MGALTASTYHGKHYSGPIKQYFGRQFGYFESSRSFQISVTQFKLLFYVQSNKNLSLYVYITIYYKRIYFTLDTSILFLFEIKKIKSCKI